MRRSTRARSGRPSDRRACSAAVLLIAPLLASPWHAMPSAGQALTVSDVRMDGSTPGVAAGQVPGAGSAPGDTFEIGDDLGERVGANRFHGLLSLDVAEGDRVAFTSALAPGSLRNVIARVSSGDPSRIEGEIVSRIDGASLFLLNPAGLLFGPAARVDVPGAIFLSTADRLAFADGSELALLDAEPDWSLHATAPSAFLFEGGVAPAAPVHLAGGPSNDVGLFARSTFVDTGEPGLCCPGDITIVAGDVTLNDQPESAADRITLDAGVPDGEPDLRAYDIRLAEIRLAAVGHEAARVPLDVAGYAPASASGVAGEALVHLGPNHRLLSDTPDQGLGRLVLRGGRLVMDRSANVTRFGGVAPGAVETGRPAAIDVVFSGDVELRSGAVLAVEDDDGDAQTGTGDLLLRAGRLTMADGASLSQLSDAGRPSGDIRVTAGEVAIEGGALILSQIQGPTSGADVRGGEVRIEADRIAIEGGAIESVTLGEGDAGHVALTAREVLTIGARSTGRSASVRSGSAARILDASGVEIQAAASGDTGDVVLDAPRVVIAGAGPADDAAGSRVGVVVGGSGQGGEVRVVDAESLVVREGAQLLNVTSQAETLGPDDPTAPDGSLAASTGAGGNLTIDADHVLVESGGQISAITGGTGPAGRLSVQDARSLEVRGRPQGGSPTGLFARSGFGGSLDPPAAPLGDAGGVSVEADSVRLVDGGRISATSTALGGGRAGDVVLDVSGGLLHIEGAQTDGIASGVSTQGLSQQAGDVTIAAGRLELVDGGVITADTLGDERAGDVRIEAGSVLISNGPSSPGADTVVSSGTILETGGGDAGRIEIVASEALEISNGARVTAGSRGDGGASEIVLRGGTVAILAGGTVSASTRIDPTILPDPNASIGNVEIEAQDRVLLVGGTIATDSNRPRSGNVSVRALREYVYADAGAAITATVDAAASASGLVVLEAPLIALDAVTIDTSSSGLGSPAGPIRIIAPQGLFRSPSTRLLTISGDPSIEDGPILVTSPQIEVLNELTIAEPTPRRAADELEESCLARRTAAGSFQIRSRAGTGPTPEDDLLPPADPARLDDAACDGP